MDATRYYQLSMTLPFVVPALVIGPVLAIEALFGIQLSPHLSDAITFALAIAFVILAGSIAMAGLPYALFTACALLLLRDRSSTSHRRFVLVSPLAFSLFFSLWTIAAASLEGTLAHHEPLKLFAGSASLVILLGYLYVGLCLIGHRVLSRRGFLRG